MFLFHPHSKAVGLGHCVEQLQDIFFTQLNFYASSLIVTESSSDFIFSLAVQACDGAELQDGRAGDGLVPHLEDGVAAARGGEAGGQHLPEGARHHGAQYGDLGGAAGLQLRHGRTLRAAFRLCKGKSNYMLL